MTLPTNSLATLYELIVAHHNELANALVRSLRQTIFSSRSELHPTILKPLADAEINALQQFVEYQDIIQVHERGNILCHQGIGNHTFISLKQTLFTFLLAATPVKEQGQVTLVLNAYYDGLTESFMKACKDRVNQEQERLRQALDRSLRQYSRQMNAAADIAAAAIATLDLTALLNDAVEHICDRFDFYRVDLYLLDQYDPSIATLRASSMPLTNKQERHISVEEEALVSWCLAHRQQRLVVYNDGHYTTDNTISDRLQSELVIPLFLEDMLGLLHLQNKRFGGLTVEQLPMFKALADQLAVAIENTILYEEAQQEIVERKRAEAAVRQSNEKLKQRNRELEVANQELEQFAYVASHDLKAPLRAIANLSEWIEEEIEDVITGDARHYMYLLRARVQRMQALIEGVLQYSQIGRFTVKRERVDVRVLLSQIINSLNIPDSFQIEIMGKMPILQTGRVRIEQVFSNLISNAIKYHDRQDGHIRISVQEKASFYEFTVADDGPGIDPQFHNKIFIMFQTLYPRDEVESTGVGLAIVKRIIDDQGGKITVESEEGQGATFRFTWPISVAD